MDKFRKQYALQKKYRQSVSGTGPAAPVKASESSSKVTSSGSISNKNNSRIIHAHAEKTKPYISSSATISTASSFESNDAKSRATAESGSRIKVKSPTSNGSRHTHESSARASFRMSKLRKHDKDKSDYKALPPTDVDANGFPSNDNYEALNGTNNVDVDAFSDFNAPQDEISTSLRRNNGSQSSLDQNYKQLASNSVEQTQTRMPIQTTTTSQPSTKSMARPSKKISEYESLNDDSDHDSLHNKTNPTDIRKKTRAPLSQRFQQLDTKNNNISEHDQSQIIDIAPISAPLHAPASIDSPTRSFSSFTGSINRKSVSAETPPRVAQSHGTVHMVPTEAQLRWAQFHQRKRSQETNEIVDKLMNQPLFVQEVEGARDGDGDSSCTSNSTSSGSEYSDDGDKSRNSNGLRKSIHNPKPKVSTKRKKRKSSKKSKNKPSRGRRALLRVSARRMEERRLFIKKNGYVMAPEDVDGIDDSESHQQSATTLDDTLIFDDIAEALHVIAIDGENNSVLTDDRPSSSIEGSSITRDRDLAVIWAGNINMSSENKFQKKSRKKASGARRLKGMRSMVRTADEDEERMKRFEDAYALMCSVGKESNSERNVAKPTKKWSRGDIAAAVSIDGRVYDDLQRSPAFKHVEASKRYGQEVVAAELNGSHPTDRGASWMIHLPKQQRSATRFFGRDVTDIPVPSGNIDDVADFISPGKLKLMQIVDRIQINTSESSQSRTQIAQQSVDGMNDSTEDSLPKTKQGRFKVFQPTKLFVNTAVTNIKKQKILTPFKVGVNVKNIRDRFLGVHTIEEPENEDFEVETEVNDFVGLTEDISDLKNFGQLSASPIFERRNMQKVVNAQVKSGHSVIDTDNQSLISEGMDAMQKARIGSLMLSPTVLTERLNQAISAIECCRWEQVNYLISANPWLAEMADVNTEQFLLHKLAYHGGGTITDDDDEEIYEAAPKELDAELIKMSSAVIYKFDMSGNLPLHMAAEAGNEQMVTELSDIFPGGASVRNTDGLLPLHLAVLACMNPHVTSPLRLVTNILALFPAALAIADNNGNLPLHLATACLTGDVGAQVVHILVSEAEKQGDNLRFSSDIKTLENIDDGASNVDSIFDDGNEVEELKSVLYVKNSLGWNPLITAIHRGAGWEVLDALLSRDGIEHIMFDVDENRHNMLQVTINQDPCDAPSVLSILKAIPDLVTIRDEDGTLPIEVACMRELQPDVIMAIALLDLPIDLDADESSTRAGFGGSWWYLNCDCDDMFVHIVREILEICDYQQKRALCFMKNRKGNSLMSRASPRCKRVLRKTLRFEERYEFVGSATKSSEEGVKIFEALDFGTDDEPWEDGRKVVLKYYGNENVYNHASSIIRNINLADSLFAEMRWFKSSTSESHSSSRIQRCIAIESPILTLRTIVTSMSKKKYRNDQERLSRYLSKTRKVFRMLGESICYLHDQGVIHGHLVLECCGKFDDGWKLMDIAGAQYSGRRMSLLVTGGASAPPEAVKFVKSRTSGKGKPILRDEVVASPSLDVWAFGKLMYEVLVGKDLVSLSKHAGINTSVDSFNVRTDEKYLYFLGNWNEEDIKNVVSDVEACGGGTLSADLISHCLCPYPDGRPKSMQSVLSHTYWSTSGSHRHSRSSMGGGNR